MLKACGYYILVEIPEKESIKSSVIMISQEFKDEEVYASDIGIIKDIGPTCFSGMEALMDIKCSIERAKKWGIKVGDKVEFTRYDGKQPTTPGYENYRFIQDQHVIARIEK